MEMRGTLKEGTSFLTERFAAKLRCYYWENFLYQCAAIALGPLGLCMVGDLRVKILEGLDFLVLRERFPIFT